MVKSRVDTARAAYLKGDPALAQKTHAVDMIQKSIKKVWLEVMMNDELKLKPVNRKEGLSSAAWVGISAIVGSFIPAYSVLFFLGEGCGCCLSIDFNRISFYRWIL